MKKSDFKPGTKVIASRNNEEYGDNELIKYFHDEYDDCIIIGIIMDKVAAADKVWVNWTEGDIDEEEEEVDMILLTLESSRSEIEKEYKEVCKQVKEKIKQAAALVREADKLAKKGYAKNLESMGAADALISAMDASGWRSSSWGC